MRSHHSGLCETLKAGSLRCTLSHLGVPLPRSGAPKPLCCKQVQSAQIWPEQSLFLLMLRASSRVRAFLSGHSPTCLPARWLQAPSVCLSTCLSLSISQRMHPPALHVHPCICHYLWIYPSPESGSALSQHLSSLRFRFPPTCFSLLVFTLQSA